MLNAKDKTKCGKRCVVAGCSKSVYLPVTNSLNVRIFDGVWDCFVKTKFRRSSSRFICSSVVICEIHFTPDSYENAMICNGNSSWIPDPETFEIGRCAHNSHGGWEVKENARKWRCHVHERRAPSKLMVARVNKSHLITHCIVIF